MGLVSFGKLGLDLLPRIDRPIVTTLEPLEKFFEAEDYHQDYARLNPGQPYIAYVSAPKVEKLRKYYGGQLKKGAI